MVLHTSAATIAWPGMQLRKGRTTQPPHMHPQMTVRDAINSALDEELARDPSVYVLGEEVRSRLYPCHAGTCGTWGSHRSPGSASYPPSPTSCNSPLDMARRSESTRERTR